MAGSPDQVMPKGQIRRASLRDVASIRALTDDAYSKWIDVIGRKPKPMTADHELAVRNHLIDLFEVDGDVRGLIEMIPGGQFLLIENLAVAPRHQGSGIGQALLDHALGVTASYGLKEIRLYTNAAFAANVAFYTRRGYVITRHEKLAGGGDMVHMAKLVPLS